MIENAESWAGEEVYHFLSVEHVKMAMHHVYRAKLFTHDPEILDKLNIAEEALRGALEKLRDEGGGSSSTGATGDEG